MNRVIAVAQLAALMCLFGGRWLHGDVAASLSAVGALLFIYALVQARLRPSTKPHSPQR